MSTDPITPTAGPATPDRTDVLGRRIGAALLDILILGVLFVIVAAVTGGLSSDDGEASAATGTGGTLLFLVLMLLYYFVSELRGGQTIGKKALGLRVVSNDGSPAGASPVAIRTLLRLVDALPFLYLVGFVAMLATGSRRARIGDLAANTSVVRA